MYKKGIINIAMHHNKIFPPVFDYERFDPVLIVGDRRSNDEFRHAITSVERNIRCSELKFMKQIPATAGEDFRDKSGIF